MVNRWLRSTDSIKHRKSTCIKLGSGRRALYPFIETSLYSDVVQKRRSGLSLSISNVCTMMRSLVDTDTFKASYSWAYGFMKRYKLKLLKPVAVAAKDWDTLDGYSIGIRDKIDGFFDYLNSLNVHQYKPEIY